MSGIFLNFCECKLESDTAIVFKSDYMGKDWFKLIRESNKDYLFYRDGNHIYFWNPISDETIKNIETKYVMEEISLEHHPRIFSKMLENKIIQLFYNIDAYNIYRNNYSTTWEIVSKNSLLNNEGLHIYRAMNLCSYFSNFQKTVILGFTLSYKLKHEFIWGREKFKDNGISCDDLSGKEDKIYPNKIAVKRYLEATGLTNTYNQILIDENKEEKEFLEISKVMKWIANKLNNAVFYKELKIKNCELKYIPYEENIMEYSIIPKPKRYYLNDKEGKGGKYDEQLKLMQPYSAPLFNNKKINIVVIAPKAFEGTVSEFLEKFKNSLVTVFHTNKVEFELLLAEGSTLKDYEEVIYHRRFQNIDLAIVVISETQRMLSVDRSPYFYCKAKYIGQGIPTQEIQIEKLRAYRLNYIINNISLNTYAKLGGTPWGIEKIEHLKKEYIIGIGSTVNEHKKMVMGIANIFDYTGKYFVGECIPLTGFDEYADKLEETVYEQIKSLIDVNTDEIRLIFHIFKSPSNRYEIKALTNIVEKISGIKVKYAFVHVGYGHNFRLLKNDGKDGVDKGFYINISENESLLNFVDKSSIPLRITVDNRSNFKDIYYLSRQIYWFSHLSFRSFLPAKKSVSIVYPSLMAGLTEKLKKVEGWDYNILKAVGDKLWFI